MKNVLTILLAVTAFSLLVLATKTHSGEPPDLLYIECVDTSDRSLIRAQRNMCDDDATAQGYNVGIFRPFNANTDGAAMTCETGTAPFSCLGAPHQEVIICPDGSVPPCEA